MINVVIKENDFKDFAVNVMNGDKAKHAATTNYASITCGLKWDSSTSPKYGYLTAGHFVKQIWNNNRNVNYNGTAFAHDSGYKMVGQYDFGLLYRDKVNYKATNKFINNSTFSYSGGSVALNQVVTKYGVKTGVTSGMVSDPNFSITIDNIDYNNLVLVSMSTATSGGDSGAPVTYQRSNRTVLTGILKGGSGNDMIYTKLSPTLNYLDASVYVEIM